MPPCHLATLPPCHLASYYHPRQSSIATRHSNRVKDEPNANFRHGRSRVDEKTQNQIRPSRLARHSILIMKNGDIASPDESLVAAGGRRPTIGRETFAVADTPRLRPLLGRSATSHCAFGLETLLLADITFLPLGDPPIGQPARLLNEIAPRPHSSGRHKTKNA